MRHTKNARRLRAHAHAHPFPVVQCVRAVTATHICRARMNAAATFARVRVAHLLTRH
jgi:hypothetical protein